MEISFKNIFREIISKILITVLSLATQKTNAYFKEMRKFEIYHNRLEIHDIWKQDW